ncbi:copper homeostasis protein CutC [Fusobacterium nucleatum]|jgi:copper homeostasis protein cutC|uniref:PF03932 family protein CutC n=1 Tax=Fusobacterium vincentii TaxID=155615 RepID=A0AAJ1FMD4_FUSVC|nr:MULTISPECIES: copper homeostasis protein CutC [Fusobacterium]ETT13582.1 CutC family protein [Fusobacterium sp. CM21]ALF20064.1 copper homeostasis protein CutC [Fusobacterium vincentii ChDC F8]EMP16703.1 copper homeostasis protein cutC [Fusobacterium nucleatum CC53]ERT46209.1 copper homeostasis protein [Fusobacterium nucleatum CTI-7]MCW0263658.1 copper homeostasis protein CutC [Fusobacterium vincentii]
MIKEACVESFEKALEAQSNGANRIELCENLAVGGTTPSYGTVKICLEKLNIPIFPMIRARGGNFVYSKDEIEIMKEDIKIFKELGVKGVVLGCLTSDNKIDLELTKELVDLAYPMEVTFHKAIDEILNPLDYIDDLVNIGIKRILTSGGEATALEGKDLINEMIKKSNGRLKIVVAGKVTKGNLNGLSNLISADEFHGKLIV